MRRHLERGGFYRADAVADALIEEARASGIVKRSFGDHFPSWRIRWLDTSSHSHSPKS